MKQDDSIKSIPNLLARTITGEAMEEEIRQVSKWRQASYENEKLYRKLIDSNFWKHKAAFNNELDLSGGYIRMIKRYRKQQRTRILKQMIAIAASLIVITLIPIAIQQLRSAQDINLATQHSIQPGKSRAKLNLADGTTVHLSKDAANSQVSQEGTSIHIDTIGLTYQSNKPLTKEIYNTILVPRGGEYMLTLSDGTRVFLNSETELRFPVQFIGNKRQLYLSGEAYFEVTSDSLSPFIVSAGSNQIEVLGTDFNVRCYPDDCDCATTLVNGQVRLKTIKTSIVMNPGEQVTVEASGDYHKEFVNPTNYTAWKDGNFVFKQQTLDEVMRTMRRWYNIKVEFTDPALKQFLFTGSIKRYDDFTKIIDMLGYTGDDIRFSIVKDKIIIYKNR